MVVVYYRKLLSSNEKALYQILIDGLGDILPTIKMPECTKTEVDRVVYALQLDRPDLFFVNWEKTVLHCVGETVLEVIPAYFYSEEYTNKLYDQLHTVGMRILEGAKGKSQYETALYLHDFLARDTRYVSYNTEQLDCYNVTGAILWHQCVCAGFAHAYKYLCDLAGIMCVTVVGNAGGVVGPAGRHAWNLLLLDGKMSYVDVTFDNCGTKEYCSHIYFLMSKERMLFDHSPDGDFELPGSGIERCPLETVANVSELPGFLRRDCGKSAYTEYLFAEPIPKASFMPQFEAAVSPSDYAFLSRIEEFSIANSEKIHAIGIKWR